MKYERITMREFAGVTGDNIYNRLAELEDKIESGELISTKEQGDNEIAFFVAHNAAVRKQVVKEFAEKLRDKEFSVKIDAEWVAVVKSRDIDEFVKEGGVRRMKQIDGEYIVKLQAATIRKFAAEDSDYPDGRAIRANERAIQKWLGKITYNADEQRQILDVVERGNWNMEDTTFKPIFDGLRALGYEVVFGRAQK